MICEILNPCNFQLIIKNYSIIMNTYMNSVKKKQTKQKQKQFHEVILQGSKPGPIVYLTQAFNTQPGWGSS